MPRPKKPRRVNFVPEATYFKPRGIPLSALEQVNLTLDELEAIRLVDLEGLEQTEACRKMKVSQSTLQRILTKAHQKIAEALVKGRSIKVEGGEVIMPRGKRRPSGRGRMGGPLAAGPGGYCVCTNSKCEYKTPHQVGKACYQEKCPKCGSPMTRE